MKRGAVLLLLALLLLPGRAKAMSLDSLPVEEWQAAAREEDVPLDVPALLSRLMDGEAGLDPDVLLAAGKTALFDLLCSQRSLLFSLLGPALVGALCRRAVTGPLAHPASSVCRLALLGALIAVFTRQMEMALRAMDRVTRLADAVCPPLLSLLTLGGGTASAAVMRPLYAFSSGAMVTLLRDAAQLLAPCACILAAAGQMSDLISTRRLFLFARGLMNKLSALATGAFSAMLALSGAWGAARDGAALRAARYAADSVLPIIGGDVASSMEALAGSAALVRNAAGTCGLLLLLGAGLSPCLKLAAASLSCRLAAALVEPVADGAEVRCLEDFASILGMLLTALCAACFLSLVLTGAILRAGSLLFLAR